MFQANGNLPYYTSKILHNRTNNVRSYVTLHKGDKRAFNAHFPPYVYY